MRQLAADLSDGYMAHTVSEPAAAYEIQAARIETGVPPELSRKDSEEERGVSCQAACPRITNSRCSIIH